MSCCFQIYSGKVGQGNNTIQFYLEPPALRREILSGLKIPPAQYNGAAFSRISANSKIPVITSLLKRRLEFFHNASSRNLALQLVVT
mmetsp:Transcript_12655/g.32029  ORF Transcript_12655/g.32029 Transcript_12655/m.32029 type:complete len:87 (+) Transcript_12655:142-402(+)